MQCSTVRAVSQSFLVLMREVKSLKLGPTFHREYRCLRIYRCQNIQMCQKTQMSDYTDVPEYIDVRLY